MSDLAKEVAQELKEHAPTLSAPQRVGLIVFANVASLLLFSVIAAAGGMIWTKAMSTDDIRDSMEDKFNETKKEYDRKLKLAEAEREEILKVAAQMAVENREMRESLDKFLAEQQEIAELDAAGPPGVSDTGLEGWMAGAPLLAPNEEPAQAQAPPRVLPVPVAEPTADAVREEEQRIRKKIDERLYREKMKE